MKIGATRTYHDVKLAVHAGADVVVVDGMQGGTAATQTVFIEHVGIPTLAALREAVDALEEMDMRGKVQLIISGGIRTGADVAKALALGADAVSIGQGTLFALGCNNETYFQNDQQHSAREAGHLARLLSPLPHRPVPGWYHYAGCPPRAAARARGRRQAPQELLPDDGHGIDRGGARLRQVQRAQPGTRGPGGVDHRGCGHGTLAAGWHQLDPGLEQQWRLETSQVPLLIETRIRLPL